LTAVDLLADRQAIARVKEDFLGAKNM